MLHSIPIAERGLELDHSDSANGWRIVGLSPDSRAARLGLEVGDTIVRAHHLPVEAILALAVWEQFPEGLTVHVRDHRTARISVLRL